VQVADRFHVLRNFREALEHVLLRHTRVPEQAFLQYTAGPVTHPLSVPPDPMLTRSQQISCERRQIRFERHQQVIELHQRGHSRGAIAFQLGLNRKTVRHWLRA
jgi:DNA-binding NarL/FixJ family response regulator